MVIRKHKESEFLKLMKLLYKYKHISENKKKDAVVWKPSRAPGKK